MLEVTDAVQSLPASGKLEDAGILDPTLYVGGAIQGFGKVLAAKGGLQLESSVAKVMGNSYKALGEVNVPIKNTELLNTLNATSKGNWMKVYEAGMQNGAKIETQYFRNSMTGQVYDVKTKYNYWHQKTFKNIGQ